jgi:chromosome segregation ATPase
LALVKEKYNQIYSYLEQKNEESLSYYNEIQRLNVVVSNLNQELLNVRTLNENLNEQYENLVKEFQLEQKMVDDLNVHTFELNKTLQSTATALQQQKEELEDAQVKIKGENEEEIESTSRMDQEVKYAAEAMREKDELIREKQQTINELNHKLNETISNYEKEINMLNENNLKLKSVEDEGHHRLSKELERLREHLVTMSDNYNKEAIQAEEREQQLRIALSHAQQLIQNQSENQESS